MSNDHPNRFLASLDLEDFGRLRSHLTVRRLTYMKALYDRGAPITEVHFPHSGLISLHVQLADGMEILVGIVGRRGVFGSASALGPAEAVSRVKVLLPGEASVIEAETLRKATEQSKTLRNALLRAEQFMYVQAQQSVACTARHDTLQRLASLLLRAQEASGLPRLPLTQDLISSMLGVQRGTLSGAASALQTARLIEYRRGHIEITDRDGLAAAACECNIRLKWFEDQLLGQDGRAV